MTRNLSKSKYIVHYVFIIIYMGFYRVSVGLEPESYVFIVYMYMYGFYRGCVCLDRKCLERKMNSINRDGYLMNAIVYFILGMV